MAGYRLTVQFI